MIYTVTLNPAIDNVIQTEAFQKGHINRACREYIFPGGKGVNVSLVLELSLIHISIRWPSRFWIPG